MAAPDLRIVRRPRGQPRPALVAASAPVDNPAKTFANVFQKTYPQNWQDESWRMVDLVGELRYYISWRANSCSRTRIIASELDETGAPTKKISSNPRVNEIAASIAGDRHGQAQLVKRAVECLTAIGETYIGVLYPPTHPTTGPGLWLAFSRDEVRSTGEETKVEMPDGPDYTLNKATDVIFRVWNPHPRYAKQADSPVRSCLPALEEIVRTTATIENAAMSRLIGNGILIVPQEMSLPSTAAPGAAGQPGDPTLPGPVSGTSDQLQNLLFAVMSTAVDHPRSQAALTPIVASVTGDLIDKIQHIRFDNEITDVAIKTRNDAIARLAMGLDVSPERMLGLGSSTSHWSAWAIGDNDVQLHIAPVMEMVCQAITDRKFRATLVANGIKNPEKYLLWYDTSQLTADPDLSDDAQKAHEANAITTAAYLELTNLGDTGYDLTTLAGAQQWARDMVIKDPTRIDKFMPLLSPALQEIDFPEPVAIEPGGQDPNAKGDGQQEPTTEDAAPGYDQGKRGRKGDVASQALIEVLVARALEFAGKRRRTRADYDRLRDVPMHQTHRAMGPVAADAIPELIKGWDSALEEDTLKLVGLDIDEVRREVRRQVRVLLTAELVDA